MTVVTGMKAKLSEIRRSQTFAATRWCLAVKPLAYAVLQQR